jgi:biopolymer transport protein ExbB
LIIQFQVSNTVKRLWDLFVASGITGIPLLLFSIVSVGLILERSIFWFRLMRRQTPVIRSALLAYEENPEGVISLLKQHLDLPSVRIFLEAISLGEASPEEFTLALEASTQAELPGLKRFNNFFEIIIAMSPLLGLLGTVLGLIQSFASLSLGDVEGSKTINVTAGISEALISTAFGLIVAMFVLFFASIFRGFYLQQVAAIQELAAQLELRYRRRLRYRVLN